VAFTHDDSLAADRRHHHSRAELRDRPIHLHTLLMKIRRLWEGWKRVSRAIGNFQARVLLTIFYVVLILPFGLAVRLFADPLRIRRLSDKWIDRDADAIDIAAARRQW
jgi:hypothetical protein